MIYILMAFISGGMVILSMIINSQLAKKIGVFQGTFINYVIGLLCIGIFLLLNNNLVNLSVNTMSKIPMWAYLGGTIGVLVVAISNIVIPKIPTIYSTLLIFIGQLFTGIIIEYLTGSLVSKGKLIGGVLILLGLLYNFNIDRKEEKEKGTVH